MRGYWFNQSTGGGGESPFPPIPPSGIIEGCRQQTQYLEQDNYMNYIPTEYTSPMFNVPAANDFANAITVWDGLYGEYTLGVDAVPNIYFYTQTKWIAELTQGATSATVNAWLAELKQWFDENRPLPLKGDAADRSRLLTTRALQPADTAKFNKHYIGGQGGGGTVIGGSGEGRRPFVLGDVDGYHPLTPVVSSATGNRVDLYQLIRQPYPITPNWTVSIESGTYLSRGTTQVYNILSRISYAIWSEVYVIKV